MPKAYSYIRMSTKRQARDGDSLRRQEKATKEYCKKNNLDLDTTMNFYDMGVSAYKGDNIEKGRLQAFLKFAQSNRIPKGSYLIVESLDRLSRQKVFDALGIFKDIIDAGITIVTTSDNMKYSKESIDKDFTQLIISISVMSRAYEETARRTERVLEAWDAKRTKITEKKLTKQCPAWMKFDEKTGSFKLIEDRAEIIRRIFKDSLSGIGSFSIARSLNQQQVKTWNRGKKWHVSYINKILNFRGTYGEFQPHRWINNKQVAEGEPVQNYYPAVIDRETFFLVQKALKGRHVRNTRTGKRFSNLFRKIIRCSYCGGTVVFVAKDSNKLRYLACENGKHKDGCEYVSWKYDDFETTFLTFVKELRIDNILDNAKIDDEIEELKANLASMSGERESLKDQLKNITDLAASTKNPPKSFLTKASELEDKIQKLKEEIISLENEIDEKHSTEITLDEHQSKALELVGKMKKFDGNELYELRAKLAEHIRILIDHIEFRPMARTQSKSEMEKKYKWMKENYVDPISEDRQDLKKYMLDYIEIVRKKDDRKEGRSLTVHFRNGGYRRIMPCLDDPTKYVFMATDDKDGYNFYTNNFKVKNKKQRKLQKRKLELMQEAMLIIASKGDYYQPKKGRLL